MSSLLDQLLPVTSGEGDAVSGGAPPGGSVTAPTPSPGVIGEFERHTLPSGSVVYYRESNHSYWSSISDDGSKGSGRVPGVSTVCKPVDYNADALLRWAARSNGEGIAILAAEAMRQPMEDWPAALAFLESQESIWQALTDRKLTYDDLRAQRSAEGRNVHEQVLQALATGRPLPDLDELPEEEQGYARAVLAWWTEHQPMPLQAEQVVYSQKHHYAGRFDLRCDMGFDKSETWLVDMKTSGYLSFGHHTQLVGYDIACEESGFGRSDKLVVLQVRSDGSWAEWPCQATDQMFLDALAVYRHAAELGKAIRKLKAAA